MIKANVKIIDFLTEVLGWNYWYQYELIDFIFKNMHIWLHA